MTTLSKAARWGAVLALGVAAGYGAHRLAQRARRELEGSAGIDWEGAEALALRVSSWQSAGVPERAAREEEYRALVAQAEPLVAAALERHLPRPIHATLVVDRREWLGANFVSLAELLAPLETIFAQLQAHAPSSVASLLGGKLAGAQLGVLFGVLARRVLGQYDMSLLSPDPEEQGTLLFVEPNILRLARELGLDAHDLREWVALHEVGHVFQFEAYPWVRPYFRELLTGMLNTLSGELLRPQAGLPQLAARLVAAPLRGEHWTYGLLSPEAKGRFERVQALMSLSEGYSNYLMKAIGRDLVPSFDLVEARMKEREANKPPLLELFDRLTGMDLKLAQYKEGESFVAAVVAARGLAFANRAWQEPDMVPTLQEIRAPHSWIARMEH